MKRRNYRPIRLSYLFAMISVLFLTVGVFNVWVNSERIQAGYALSGLKNKFAEIEWTNRRLKLEIALLKSPEYLEGEALLKLGLRQPLPNQVVFLP